MLEPADWPHRGLSPLNAIICVLIVAASVVAILETEETLVREHEHLFTLCELILGIAFLIEYLVRLWTCVEDPRYRRPVVGRLRYLVTPAALIDLAAILPIFFLVLGSHTMLLRVVRLLRVLRLARLGRFSDALQLMTGAFHSRRHELTLSASLALLLLIFSSTLLYLAESEAQPEAFGSIPRAMWWAVETLTTVGYGDVVPVTRLGRILAGITAICGIGLIALPTGILAAAFSEAMQEHKRKQGGVRRTEDSERS